MPPFPDTTALVDAISQLSLLMTQDNMMMFLDGAAGIACGLILWVGIVINI